MDRNNILKLSPFWFGIISIAIFISIVGTIVFVFVSSKTVDNKISDQTEKNRPANLTIRVVTDKTCIDCFDWKKVISVLSKQNVKITSSSVFDYQDSKGGNLLKQYNLKRLPAIIIGGEIYKDTSLTKMWTDIGAKVTSSVAIVEVGFPYLEVSTGKVRGKIQITLLDDSNCSNCYDVKNHLTILSKFGLPVSVTKTIDSASTTGKALISKYKINKIPTLILSGDMSAYIGFDNVWKEVGTVESDKTYIFRDGVAQMGNYYDLILNKIVNYTNS